MSEEKKEALHVEIDGVEYPLEEKVFNLMINISRERDYYYGLLEYTHSLCQKQTGMYERCQEIESALQMQRKYREDRKSTN